MLVRKAWELEVVSEFGVISPSRRPGEDGGIAIDGLVSARICVGEPIKPQVSKFSEDDGFLVIGQLGEGGGNFRRRHGVLRCRCLTGFSNQSQGQTFVGSPGDVFVFIIDVLDEVFPQGGSIVVALLCQCDVQRVIRPADAHGA